MTSPAPEPSPDSSPDPSPDPSPASQDPPLISEPSPEGSEGPTPSKTLTATPAPDAAGDEGLARGPAQSATASATDNRFRPLELTVTVGTKVVWTNVGQNLHTVTANDRTFDSGTLEGGQTFAVTFDEVGHFPYYCQIHGEPGSGMFGLVIVRPAKDEGTGVPPTGPSDDTAATGLDPTSLALLAASLGLGLASLRAGRAKSRKEVMRSDQGCTSGNAIRILEEGERYEKG